MRPDEVSIVTEKALKAIVASPNSIACIEDLEERLKVGLSIGPSINLRLIADCGKILRLRKAYFSEISIDDLQKASQMEDIRLKVFNCTINVFNSSKLCCHQEIVVHVVMTAKELIEAMDRVALRSSYKFLQPGEPLIRYIATSWCLAGTYFQSYRTAGFWTCPV